MRHTTKRLLLFTLLATTLCSCGRKSIDEQFEENARQETQQMCPRKIDDCTVLDSIVYDRKSRTQFHYYTFSGNMDDSTLFTKNFVDDIRETMLKSLRNEIKLKKQMEAEINFGYTYHSQTTGKTLLRLVFTKNDYTGPLKQRTFNQRITSKWEDYTLKHCPEVQDECTTLTSVSYDSVASQMNYEFELKGVLDTDSFDIRYPDAAKELKKMLVKGIRQNESLKEERENDIDYNLIYRSKSTGDILIKLKIKHAEISK